MFAKGRGVAAGAGFALAMAAVLALGLAAPARAQELTVARTRVDDLKSVFATVESVHVTPARARIGGTVGALSVQEGSRVALGDTLAVVADPKLTLRLTALDARITSLRAQQKLAAIELRRMQSLRQGGTVSQARLDDAQTNVDVVAANLAAMRAERAVVAEQLAEGAVLAPADGRVLHVDVVDGTVVMPGETVASIAVERYVLRMRLPERHAKFIRQGDRVLVGARGLEVGAEKLVKGRISLVYPELDQGRVVADVDVTGLGDFFVGERTRVYVSTGTRETVIVPKPYVFKRYGVSYVRVKGIGDTVVQPGEPRADGVEILSGLRPGDVLLPAGPQS